MLTTTKQSIQSKIADIYKRGIQANLSRISTSGKLVGSVGLGATVLSSGATFVVDDTQAGQIGQAALDVANSLVSNLAVLLPYLVPVIVVMFIIGLVIGLIKRR